MARETVVSKAVLRTIAQVVKFPSDLRFTLQLGRLSVAAMVLGSRESCEEVSALCQHAMLTVTRSYPQGDFPSGCQAALFALRMLSAMCSQADHIKAASIVKENQRWRQILIALRDQGPCSPGDLVARLREKDLLKGMPGLNSSTISRDCFVLLQQHLVTGESNARGLTRVAISEVGISGLQALTMHEQPIEPDGVQDESCEEFICTTEDEGVIDLDETVSDENKGWWNCDSKLDLQNAFSAIS